MGGERPASSIERQSSFAERMASDFDTTLLRNLVWLRIENDGQLTEERGESLAVYGGDESDNLAASHTRIYGWIFYGKGIRTIM